MSDLRENEAIQALRRECDFLKKINEDVGKAWDEQKNIVPDLISEKWQLQAENKKLKKEIDNLQKKINNFKQNLNELTFIPLSLLEINSRALNALYSKFDKEFNIYAFADVKETELLRIPNFGRSSLKSLKLALSEFNIKLKK